MARISRFYLSAVALEKMNSIFFEVIKGLRTKIEFFEVIDEIISPVEKVMIAKRIILMYLILKKIEYQTISQTLKVSQGTIAKFSLLLANSPHIKKRLERIIETDEVKLLFQDLVSSIFTPGSIGTDWKGAWSRKLEVERKKATGI